ncbi:TRAP transporter small permease subunit [Parvibium lacunae]|uniref:TRAP transporter small permease protein n=1 Tax=Parvibium lacunae TaxID=1888893 RepID=A0A368KYJ7_9BURK|nr:TRAP transporter small permease subunit [Parvibium lacunae]RCS56505.1 sugar transporter [Parvibium lacunae]
MSFLLGISRLIDAVNEKIGAWVSWLSLVAVIVSSLNAIMRYSFDLSSNAWLELQWYLFAAVFMLAGAYSLRHNEHVRIDIIFNKLSPKKQAIVDTFGMLLFLTPMCLIVIYDGWGFFAESWRIQEMSSNPGGLIRWPVKLLIPVGFTLLFLQGISQLIKQLAFLADRAENPLEYHEKVR